MSSTPRPLACCNARLGLRCFETHLECSHAFADARTHLPLRLCHRRYNSQHVLFRLKSVFHRAFCRSRLLCFANMQSSAHMLFHVWLKYVHVLCVTRLFLASGGRALRRWLACFQGLHFLLPPRCPAQVPWTSGKMTIRLPRHFMLCFETAECRTQRHHP